MLRVVLTAVVVMALSGCFTALSGRLQDPSGKPISNSDARVNITKLNPDDSTASDDPVVCEVDSSGQFAVSVDLVSGSYLVEALVPGYSIASKIILLDDKKKQSPLVLTAKPLEKPVANAVGLRIKKGKAATSGNDDLSRGAGAATLTPPQM
jgi:hypothetical protein